MWSYNFQESYTPPAIRSSVSDGLIEMRGMVPFYPFYKMR
jgi:hypothetical protein